MEIKKDQNTGAKYVEFGNGSKIFAKLELTNPTGSVKDRTALGLINDAIINNNIAYIGWDIFSAYALHGHLCFKELFKAIMEKMLGDEKTISVNIPDKAVVTLTRQENRSMLHLLYAHTTVRGKGTEVIEDTVPLYNVECSVKYNKKPS